MRRNLLYCTRWGWCREDCGGFRKTQRAIPAAVAAAPCPTLPPSSFYSIGSRHSDDSKKRQWGPLGRLGASAGGTFRACWRLLAVSRGLLGRLHYFLLLSPLLVPLLPFRYTSPPSSLFQPRPSSHFFPPRHFFSTWQALNICDGCSGKLEVQS